jgi:hypothetical protein
MYGARASAEACSAAAPRPLASTKLPLPRFFATRSGKAKASITPVLKSASARELLGEETCDAQRRAISRALAARCARSRRN